MEILRWKVEIWVAAGLVLVVSFFFFFFLDGGILGRDVSRD